MVRRVAINLDSRIDQDIRFIMESFKQKGFHNIKKTDVVRLLIQNYKNRENETQIKRKPKSQEWMML